jgi:hypothetical protein
MAKAKEGMDEMWQRFAVTMTFRDRVYGGIPRQQHVFDAWQRARQSKMTLVEPTAAELERGLVPAAEMAERMPEEDREEVGELEESVEAGETIFRADAQGIFLRDFMVKDAIKEATQRLGYYQRLKKNVDGMGLRSHLQTGVYVEPRRLYLLRDDKVLTAADGSDEAQGRVPTPRGPKSILRKSEYVDRPTITFQLKMLPFKGFAEPEWRRVLMLVCEIGVGAWRSREEGKLELISFGVITPA